MPRCDTRKRSKWVPESAFRVLMGAWGHALSHAPSSRDLGASRKRLDPSHPSFALNCDRPAVAVLNDRFQYFPAFLASL